MSPWQELRSTNRDLAFILLFAPASRREAAADLFLFASELDKAIHIPSEIMLAAIRLQWWHDALTAETPSTVPLVSRFQQHFAAGLLAQDDVVGLIDSWRDRLADDEIPPHICWAGCWDLVAGLLHAGQHNAEARAIGSRFIAEQQAPETRLDHAAITALPSSPSLPAWIKMAHYVIRYWHQNPTVDPEDPTLIWRMLLWRCGVTPKQPTP